MTFSFGQLQKESKAWVAHNFGARPAHQPVLGLAEEYGELLAAENLPAIKDAVADIVIFLTDLCNCCDVSMDLLNMRNHTYEYTITMSRLEREVGKVVGKIAHHYLKREQGIRGTAAFHQLKIATYAEELLSLLNVYSKLCGFDFITNIENTWAQVRARDWTKQREVAGAIPVAVTLPARAAATEELKTLDEYSAYKAYR